MKETFNILFRKKLDLEREQDKIESAIEALQQLCTHDYLPAGVDDKEQTYYRCRICRQETYKNHDS